MGEHSMAAPTPLPNSPGRISQPTGLNAQVFIQEMPEIPQDVKDRFPSMAKYEAEMKNWVKNLNFNVNPQ
jgi:hypothetical protein